MSSVYWVEVSRTLRGTGSQNVLQWQEREKKGKSLSIFLIAEAERRDLCLRLFFNKQISGERQGGFKQYVIIARHIPMYRNLHD